MISDNVPAGWNFFRFGIPRPGDYYVDSCGFVVQRPVDRDRFVDYAFDRIIVKPSGEGVA